MARTKGSVVAAKKAAKRALREQKFRTVTASFMKPTKKPKVCFGTDAEGKRVAIHIPAKKKIRSQT